MANARKATKRVAQPLDDAAKSYASSKKELKKQKKAAKAEKKKAARKAKKKVTKTSGVASNRKAASKVNKKGKRKKPLILRILIGIVIAFAALVLIVLILALTPLFTIEHVDYEPSAHVSADDIKQLAPIPQGTTLLSVNPFVIDAEVRRNPWIASAVLTREFPSTLKISVVERTPLALVETSSSETAWYLGEDENWIEPATLPTGPGVDNATAILNLAKTEHTLLIKDIPDTCSPKAGAKVTDEEVLDALKIKSGFSAQLANQIMVISAPNANSFTLTLTSEVSVGLGDTSDLSSKEAVILKLLEKYPNQITYINVKTPSKPTFRKVDVTNTQSAKK